MPTLTPAAITAFGNALSNPNPNNPPNVGTEGAAVWAALQVLDQNSPTLVSLMNIWAGLDPNGRNIVLGAPSGGTFTTPANTGNGQLATIKLDPATYLHSTDTLGSNQATSEALGLASVLRGEQSAENAATAINAALHLDLLKKCSGASVTYPVYEFSPTGPTRRRGD